MQKKRDILLMNSGQSGPSPPPAVCGGKKMEISRHSTPCTRSSTKMGRLNFFSPGQKHVVRGILGYVCAKNQSVLVIFGVV